MSEQKTRFYLIRHGETLWNRQGRYQGSTDIELSEEGLAQAELWQSVSVICLWTRFMLLP